MKEKIGILDSGIGGLSVYETVRSHFVGVDILYLADEAHLPYGVKSKEVVRSLVLKQIETLRTLGAKWVIVACNTATASIADICEQDPNIIGIVEPTAYAALQCTKNQKIALFATQLTVESKVYEKYLLRDMEVAVNCSDLVPLIENMDFSSEELLERIQEHLKQVQESDTLILGCTHFKWIKFIITRIRPTLHLIDSGEPIVNVLKKRGIQEQNDMFLQGESMYYTTGDIEKAKYQLEQMHLHFDQIQKIQ